MTTSRTVRCRAADDRGSANSELRRLLVRDLGGLILSQLLSTRRPDHLAFDRLAWQAAMPTPRQPSEPDATATETADAADDDLRRGEPLRTVRPQASRHRAVDGGLILGIAAFFVLPDVLAAADFDDLRARAAGPQTKRRRSVDAARAPPGAIRT
jgi:hypothetical protein